MQLSVADPAVDQVDLVLEAWSAAPAAQSALEGDDARTDELVAQLSLRLEDVQIPLWDARA